MDVVEVQKKVSPQIEELIKKEPEGISSIEKSGEGWTVQCHVLEKKSVPETYDILKIFEFKLDKDAKIMGFKQIGKVRRGDLS